MMKRKLFNNPIPYNKKSIFYYNSEYTLNLSSLYHVYNYRLKIPSLKNVAYTQENLQFGFQNILFYKKIIKIKKFNKNTYIVHIQPDVFKIAKIFGTKIPQKILVDKDEINEYIETLRSIIFNTFEKIDNFIEERSRFILGRKTDDFKFKGMSRINSDEIKKLIYKINQLLPTKIVNFDDYVCKNNFIKKLKYEIKMNAFTDYQSVFNYFKNLVDKKIEYFNGQEEIDRLDKLEKQYNEIIENSINGNFYEPQLLNVKLAKTLTISEIDEINTSTLFKTENFALICLTLKDYVEKEKAINEFIHKIQTKTLQTCI